MNKESKLNFTRPSGESRLDESSKKGITKMETVRSTVDLPKDLVVKLKIKAAQDGVTMKDIHIAALCKYLNE
jgi:hypothetical protein